MAELQEAVLALRERCVWLQSCFDMFEGLFFSGQARRDLMTSAAPAFFEELNVILIDYYIVLVCSITDPASTMGRSNLTVKHLDEQMNVLGVSTPALRTLSAGLHRYRDLILLARNRSIAHADKETVLRNLVLGQTHRAEALAFFEFLHDYFDKAAAACGVDALDFRSTRGPGDVCDLFKTLNGGTWVPPVPG